MGEVGNPNWKKGVSGNPDGLSKRNMRKRRELRMILEKICKRKFGKDHWVAERLVELCDDRDGKIAVAAIKIIMPYLYGAPPQRIEMTGADGGPVDVITRDVLSSRIARLKK